MNGSSVLSVSLRVILRTSLMTIENTRRIACPLSKMIDSGILCSLAIFFVYAPVSFSIFLCILGR